MFLKGLRKFTVNLIAGANVASIAALLAVGYSDHISPADHPLAASIGLLFPFVLAVNVLFLLFWLLVKPRMAVIPIVGLIINYVPVRTYCPVNLPQEVPDDAIRVMTYNVKFGEEGGERNGLPLCMDYALNSGTDLLCIQEGKLNARLDSAAAEHYPYHEAIVYGGNARLLLYSRFPIVGKERLEYESRGNGSGVFFVEIGGQTVAVVNNHLETSGLSLADRDEINSIVKGHTTGRDTLRNESRRLMGKLGAKSKIRAPQAEAVARYVSDHRDMPVILCGDFNDSPISYAHHVVARELTDCFVAAGCGPGWSYRNSYMRVRIDNIMCSPHFTPVRCNVDTKIVASDHFPVQCWLKMHPK